MFQMVQAASTQRIESQPLLVSGSSNTPNPKPNSVKKGIVSIALALLLSLLLLRLIPITSLDNPPNISLDLQIPSFSGPTGTIYETVYYSHYISRILGNAVSSSTEEEAIRSIETIRQWMGHWVESRRDTLANSDLQTAESVLGIYSAYVLKRSTSDSQYFWPRLLEVFRLRDQDVKEEIMADQDAENFSLEGQKRLSLAKQMLQQESGLQSPPRPQLKGLYSKFAERAIASDKQVTWIDEFVKELASQSEGDIASSLSSLPLPIKGGLVGMKVNRLNILNPETPAHAFLNTLEVLRLSLPMSAQDQLFVRVVELLTVGWNNYMYLKPKGAAYILSELEKPQEPAANTSNWFKLAKETWGAN